MTKNELLNRYSKCKDDVQLMDAILNENYMSDQAAYIRFCRDAVFVACQHNGNAFIDALDGFTNYLSYTDGVAMSMGITMLILSMQFDAIPRFVVEKAMEFKDRYGLEYYYTTLAAVIFTAVSVCRN